MFGEVTTLTGVSAAEIAAERILVSADMRATTDQVHDNSAIHKLWGFNSTKAMLTYEWIPLADAQIANFFRPSLNLINFCRTTYIGIRSTLPANSANGRTAAQMNVLAIVPVKGSFGDFIDFTENDPLPLQIFQTQAGGFHMDLIDDQYNVIELNASQWTAVIDIAVFHKQSINAN